MFRIEEIIAAKNNKQKKHTDLWTEVEDYLTQILSQVNI
jgi:hypothetical protein